MTDMFTNYQNLSEYYRPDNLSMAISTPVSYTKFDSSRITLPYELYNVKGELEGYTWNYGETVTLDFSIDGYFTINSEDKILYKASECPTQFTEGRLGQKIYNIVDYKSWECVSYSGNTYVWREDQEFTYPLNTKEYVYVDASDYLRDKLITFRLYDFRLEEIYNKNFSGSSKVKIFIDTEMTKLLKKGIYYCSLEIVGNNSCEKVFDVTDCKLLVK